MRNVVPTLGGALLGYTFARFLTDFGPYPKLPEPAPNSAPGSEGHACGPSFMGDLGSCNAGLVCLPGFMGSTCVTPEFKLKVELVQASGAVLGGLIGYYLAERF